jgi:hypothetical protein
MLTWWWTAWQSWTWQHYEASSSSRRANSPEVLSHHDDVHADVVVTSLAELDLATLRGQQQQQQRPAQQW